MMPDPAIPAQKKPLAVLILEYMLHCQRVLRERRLHDHGSPGGDDRLRGDIRHHVDLLVDSSDPELREHEALVREAIRALSVERMVGEATALQQMLDGSAE